MYCIPHCRHFHICYYNKTFLLSFEISPPSSVKTSGKRKAWNMGTFKIIVFARHDMRVNLDSITVFIYLILLWMSIRYEKKWLTFHHLFILLRLPSRFIFFRKTSQSQSHPHTRTVAIQLGCNSCIDRKFIR